MLRFIGDGTSIKIGATLSSSLTSDVKPSINARILNTLPAMQVIVLRALQSRLLEALSKVHNGAAQLAVLKRPEKEVLPVLAGAADDPAGEGERERLLYGARKATRKCIESILSVSALLCLSPCSCSCTCRVSACGPALSIAY